jgi:FMN-dependent NADH-azoreductase
MRTILQVNSSLNAEKGVSTQLASELVAALRAAHPETALIVRDLAREPVPHLDAARFAAFVAPAAALTAAQAEVLRHSDTLIAELRRADVIVLGLPMYNFGVPSQLKAWFDHVARAGVTFKYTDKGAVGLLRGKKAYVLAARGGRYAGTPADTQTAYVRSFLAFLGVTDVEFVYAEGLAIGETSRTEALASARASLYRVAAQERIAA